jgi:hypothetical protein
LNTSANTEFAKTEALEPSAGLLGPVIAVGIVFAVAGALTGWASSDMPSDADARRREIASMSRAERDRLERNLHRFQAASAEDRQRLRRLDTLVHRDSALEQTLREYTAWLDDLSPWQRQEVAAGDDADVKVAVIRRILADQKRQREEYEREQERLNELFNNQRNRYVPQFGSRPGFHEWERLGCDDVARALRPLEEAIPAELRPPAHLDTADWNLEVLSAALKHYSKRPEFNEEPIPRPVLADIVAELPDERRQQFYKSHIEKSEGPRFLTAVLVKIASENWWDEARRERRMPKSRAEVEALVTKLSPESQAEFARLQADSPHKTFEAYVQLMRAYHDLWTEERAAEFNRRSAELRDVYKKLDFRGPFPEPFGGPPSPGSRGPGFRGDGSRGDDARGFGRGPSDGRGFHRPGDRNDDDRREPRDDVERNEPARAERPPMATGSDQPH